jgi:membrane-bound metal-dependent hydrolase YbcI (DUF457 family)
MPSPIGHTLAGYVLTRHLGTEVLSPWRWVLFVAVVTSLPDLDFLPGLVVGDSGRYHRHFSHSLSATLAVALALGALWRFRGRRFLPMFLLAGLAYGSHLLVDSFILLDTSRPVGPREGVMLFWPFSERMVAIHVPVFRQIVHGGEGLGFVASVLTWRNFLAMAWEALVLLPLAVLVEFAARRGARAAAAPGRPTTKLRSDLPSEAGY